MSDNGQVKSGRESSEYGIIRTLVWVGAALMLVPLAMLAFGKVNAGDLGWSEYLEFLKWVAMTGAGLCATVAGWYTAKRTDLKKTLTSGLMVLCVLGLLAAPALAGTVIGTSDTATPAAPTVATTSEAPQPAAQASPESGDMAAAWNQIKQFLGLEQDGKALTPQQAAAVLSIVQKLNQQNTQLKTELDSAQAKSQVFGLSGGASQVDALMAALAARVNQNRVLSGLGNVAYGGGQGLVNGAAGYAPASQGLTKADIRQAVKEEIEANKTWWDKAPWWARAGLGVGLLAIGQDLGITLPGL